MIRPKKGDHFFGDLNGWYGYTEQESNWPDGDNRYVVRYTEGDDRVTIAGENRYKKRSDCWIDRTDIKWLNKERVWVFKN